MATDPVEARQAARLARLRAESTELARELEGLRQFMASMVRVMRAVEEPSPPTEARALLSRVVSNAMQAIGASDATLLVPAPRGEDLVFVLIVGESRKEGLLGKRVPAGRGVAGWVARHRRATIVNNVPEDDRFDVDANLELTPRTSSLLAAPLIAGDRLLGVVEVLDRRDGAVFSTGNQTLLTLMCRFAGELLYPVVKDLDLTATIPGASAS